jgi:2-oxo-4-hydroxy-4-carboxy-5-ureidoimidazoline decarboxylase
MQKPGSTVGGRPVERLNTVPVDVARTELRSCCAAEAWLGAVLAGRPYASLDDLLDTSDAAVAAFDEDDLAQALSVHPRIGERATGETREDDWSRTEQAGALTAGSDLAADLARGNRAYEERFDRVFLIRAAGRTAQQMHEQLQSRLGNDDETERAVVLRELGEIVRLRLTRLVEG